MGVSYVVEDDVIEGDVGWGQFNATVKNETSSNCLREFALIRDRGDRFLRISQELYAAVFIELSAMVIIPALASVLYEEARNRRARGD
jgi:hypothetical protein